MKQVKKLVIIMLFIQMAILIMPNKDNKVLASPNLVVVKTSTGSDLTYRNSSEKVYMLSEYNYPTSQLRACWVSTFAGDFPAYQSESQYKADMNALLNNMESMGMNTIIFHIRTHNNALYKSELNPLASWWSKVNFDVFDPLEWTIAECHRRGIEFHAWLNPYRVSVNGTNQYNISGSIPAVNPANNWDNLIKSGNSVILDPGIPENRDFIVDTCMEVVENYDVDAIHFDDYFYISGTDDATTRAKYNTGNLSIADFRRKQVDLFIEDLSNHLRQYNQENNKCIQLGISPSNVYQNGSYSTGPKYDANGNMTSPLGSNTGGFAHYGDYLYSDTLNWINHEWIDYIMPQAYHSIEQTAASYAEIVRWWSWAVRYKKVNLYTGIGIYMVFENNEYWKRHVNEVELELLISGQYPEFKGASFYKYSNLTKTSNDTIAHAVNTISNDFWKKRIPAAVLPYYAPLTPEVKVSNVSYESSTKTISWSPLEKVRGYMVYQVPKGQTLDKNNINHVLEYTQNTSITVKDVENYEYYIASVNLANETSEVELVIVNLTAQDIIQLIDALPNSISSNDVDNVRYARAMYEKLSNAEKSKVTNLDKLIRLENSLGNYDTLEAYLNSYINNLDKHIKTNRVLPTPQNVTLSYKNEADQNLYSITTGTRFKEYLAIKEITLIATISENNISVSKEFNVNIGLTGTDQVGLFYRNDPSSMGKDDEGEYGVGNSKYIGWSRHTFTIENYVLYIAINNYHEITESNNIPKCSWSSVAGVYVNKTSSAVTMKLGNAFASKSCDNDGYFILSNGKVKTLSHGFDPEETIKLESNETLLIVRYLDNALTGSPLTPVSKFTVGTKAYIDEENSTTNEELAKIIIDKINAIQTPITLAQEETILSVKDEYNNASKEIQDLVTNYNKLIEYLSEIASLNEELNATRANSIQSLNSYVKLEEYSAENQEKIKTIINEGSNLINQSISKEEISAIVKTYKEKLDQIQTITEELESYKQEQLREFSKINYQLYYVEEKTIIKSIVADAISKVNNATSKDEIDQLMTKALQEISKVKTISQYVEELESYKQEQLQEFSKINYQLYYEEEQNSIRSIVAEATSKVNNATSKDEIDQLMTKALQEISKVKTISQYSEELNNYKEEQIELLDNYLDKTLYNETEISSINDIISNATEKIKSSQTKEEIDLAVNDAINKLDEIPTSETTLQIVKNQYMEKIDELNNSYSDFEENYKEQINLICNHSKEQINNAATIDEVKGYYAQAQLNIDNYFEELENAKYEAEKAINEVINQLNLVDKEKEEINNTVSSIITTMNKAATTEEVSQLKEQCINEINNYHNTIESAKTDTLDAMKKLILDTYSKGQIKYLNQLLQEQEAMIKEAGTIEALASIQEVFTNKLNEYISKTNSKIKLINDYLADINTDTLYVNSLVKEAKNSLNEASTIEEMEKVKVDFEKKLNEYLANNPNPNLPDDGKLPNDQNNNCNCASLIYSLIFVISSCLIIIIRKNAHR